jgi:hypothetical protein
MVASAAAVLPVVGMELAETAMATAATTGCWLTAGAVVAADALAVPSLCVALVLSPEVSCVAADAVCCCVEVACVCAG